MLSNHCRFIYVTLSRCSLVNNSSCNNARILSGIMPEQDRITAFLIAEDNRGSTLLFFCKIITMSCFLSSSLNLYREEIANN